MDWKSVVVDVSSFLLIESSGDSENDFESSLVALSHNITTADDDDDDAGSCNYHEYVDVEEEDDGEEEEEDDDDQDDHNDNCVIVDCKRTCKKTGSQNIALEYMQSEQIDERAVISTDSSGEIMMNEEEKKNKLFWETCLTFGLPMNI